MTTTMTAATVCPSCATAGHETAGDRDGLLGALLPALKPWLVSRRWFTHETGCLETLRTLQGSVLHEDEHTALLHFLFAADHDGGASHSYQVMLGLRRTWPTHLPGRSFGRCAGGRWDGWWMYDAADDPTMMRSLIKDTVHPATRSGPCLMLADGVSAGVVEQLEPRVLGIEQSNTSVVYGDRLMLKFFRSPKPGTNREAATLDALALQQCTRVPKLAGLLRARPQGQAPTVLGVLTDFIENEGDGWERGVAQAARYIGVCRPIVDGTGAFYIQAYALGEAVAEVHACLRRAFGIRRLTPSEASHQAAAMTARFTEAADTVPALAAYAPAIKSRYLDFARAAHQPEGLITQRIHGDLHLGQVLSTAGTWKVIDFEGEPDAPSTDSDADFRPVLTDVAGMFRSFDYAAQQAIRHVESKRPAATDEDRALRRCRAEAWIECSRQAFAAGYMAAGGENPFRRREILRALEADKAVYEAVYETHHRPDWLPIPLEAVATLAA